MPGVGDGDEGEEPGRDEADRQAQRVFRHVRAELRVDEQDGGEGSRGKPRGREAGPRTVGQRGGYRDERKEHRERRRRVAREGQKACDQRHRHEDLGEGHQATSLRGSEQLVEDQDRDDRDAAERKIWAWSARNKPLIPTPSSTMVMVSHQTTRSVCWASRPSARAPCCGVTDVESEAERSLIVVSLAEVVGHPTAGQNDPNQEQARENRGHGDDGLLWRHDPLVRPLPRAWSGAPKTGIRRLRPASASMGTRRGWRKRTNPSVPPQLWTRSQHCGTAGTR